MSCHAVNTAVAVRAVCSSGKTPVSWTASDVSEVEVVNRLPTSSTAPMAVRVVGMQGLAVSRSFAVSVHFQVGWKPGSLDAGIWAKRARFGELLGSGAGELGASTVDVGASDGGVVTLVLLGGVEDEVSPDVLPPVLPGVATEPEGVWSFGATEEAVGGIARLGLLDPALVEPVPVQAVVTDSAATVTNTPAVERLRRMTSPPEEQLAVTNRRSDTR